MSDITRKEALSEIAQASSTPIPNRSNRKFAFDFSQVSTYPTSFLEDGKMRHETGYFKADSVRLIQVSVRDQIVKKDRQAFIASFVFIADNEEIGLIDSDNNMIPHPFYTSEEYRIWREMLSPTEQAIPGRDRLLKPHRIAGQQFVYSPRENKPGSVDLLLKFCNDLKDLGMDFQPEPAQVPGRTTKDMFRMVPRTRAGVDITNTGVLVDGFEISVNPNYDEGFRSFYAGLEDQRNRLERMIQYRMDGRDELFQEARKSFERNSHHLNGVYDEKKNGVLTGSQWPRTADVGIITVGSTSYPLYRRGVDEIKMDMFDEVINRNREKLARQASDIPDIPL